MLDADEAVASVRSMAELPDDVRQMIATRAVPVSGVLACVEISRCQPGKVWLIYWPDWVGIDGEIGWMYVDAMTGNLMGGHSVQRP